MKLIWKDGEVDEYELGDAPPSMIDAETGERPEEVLFTMEELHEMIDADDERTIELLKFYINHLFNGLANEAKITLVRKPAIERV